jgi:NADH-quinone oxidoreductase subunit L
MYLWVPSLPRQLAGSLRYLYLFSLNKWYFDELYDWLFVRPAMKLGYGLWKSGDGALIDQCGPDGVAAMARNIAARASRLQTGYLYHYAFAMMVGVVVLVSLYILSRQG